MSFKNRCEIQIYKLAALLPVTCTFLLYMFLSLYYVNVSSITILSVVQFYLYPTIQMDFSQISFKDVWEDEAKAHR